ncbi:MAG: hypothetical protein MJ198_07080 [Bacteroidales bacterium]|nr:hypothetical protein [Bacteroidales bacterium]
MVKAIQNLLDFKPKEVLIKDVGQANWIEILDEKNQVRIVFDMGVPISAGKNEVLAKINEINWKDNTVKPVFVLSHWHLDHFHALYAIKEHLTDYFSAIIVPNCPQKSMIRTTLAELVQNNMSLYEFVDYLCPSSEERIEKILNKTNVSMFRFKYEKNENYRCLGLIVHSDKKYCILSGDMSNAQINEMLDLEALDGTETLYLVVPHHGGKAGKDSLMRTFSECVISVGKNNPYGHPKKVILNALKKRSKVFLTSIQGTQKILLN